MIKNDWLKTLIFLQKEIIILKQNPEEKSKLILNYYILILLIENFLNQQKISELKNNETLNFSDFANYTKTMNLSTFFCNATFDEEQKAIIIDPLSDCLKDIEEINTQHPKRNNLPKSKSEPYFFSPQKTYYLLNAKSIVTILTKSDASELKNVFMYQENIFKMMQTSDDVFPVLRNLLPITQQIVIYRKLYDKTFYSHHLTHLQNFIGQLHAIEFSKQKITNQQCRHYYRFLILVDKILENRKIIPIETRKKISMHIVCALIQVYEQKALDFYTLSSLLTLKNHVKPPNLHRVMK